MSKCEQCFIKEFNALKYLTKNELINISGCKTTHTVKKGEVLFEEGDILNGIYCIRDGICKLSKLSANGKDQIVKIVVKGDLIGQRSLINNKCSNLQAVALNDMKVCFIPKKEIVKDLKNNTDFLFDILKSMTSDLKNAYDVIVSMAQKSVKQRLAETLIYVHKSSGTNSNGTIRASLSREDIANMVGTATESAIRILSQFKKEGLISTTGKQIKIEDLQGLKRIE